MDGYVPVRLAPVRLAPIRLAPIRHAVWQFHCPDCGFGDAEHGHLLTAQEIYCVVCLEEDGRHVRLQRWETPEIEVPAG
jgi:hypothetical protein